MSEFSRCIYYFFGLIPGSPQAMLNTMWFYFTIGFGTRGRQEHVSMLWGDIELKTTTSGEEFIQFTERATKTRMGQDGNTRHDAPKIFSNPGTYKLI